MTSFTPTAATPFRAAFLALIEAGRGLLAHLTLRATPAAPSAPRPAAHRPTPQQRVAYALEWAAALARTLAGERFFLPPLFAYPRFPSFTADLRASIGLPPLPPPTEAARAAGRLHYIRRVFATQPTGRIAARIARRLDLTQASPAWPTDLVALPEPPAIYATRPRPTPPSPLTEASQPKSAATADAPPAPRTG